jgi:hypothetical protein
MPTPAEVKNAGLTYAAGDVVAYVGIPSELPPTGFEDLGTEAGANYRCLGWLDTSGYIFKLDETTKDIGAAGTLSSIRTINTGGTKTIQATALEAMNPYVRCVYDEVPVFPIATNPTKPSGSTNIASYILPDPPLDNRYTVVMDSVDGVKMMRMYFPNCKITARGDDQVQQADIEMMQLTFSCYPGVIPTTVTTPGVPTSNTPVTNATGQPVNVTITGGTMTAVVVNGTTVGVGAGTYQVPSGGTITLTFTVAPTWNWIGAGTTGIAKRFLNYGSNVMTGDYT